MLQEGFQPLVTWFLLTCSVIVLDCQKRLSHQSTDAGPAGKAAKKTPATGQKVERHSWQSWFVTPLGFMVICQCTVFSGNKNQCGIWRETALGCRVAEVVAMGKKVGV